MDVSEYEAQVDSINVDDIAKNSNNRFVLRRIKRNNADDDNRLYVQNQHDVEVYDDDVEGCIDYVPEGADDMGWLGYFVGKNNHLHDLHIRPFTPTSGSSVMDVMEPFFRGVSRNKSIRAIDFDDTNLLGGEMFTMLTPFFQNNHNLIDINIHDCDFGDDGCRLFALALGGSSTNKSLQKVELYNNGISEEEMVDIITALSMHPHLKWLDFDENLLRKNGCVALATLLQCSATELENLYISHNEINDEGIEALVPALANCIHLKTFEIRTNPSITIRGWQRFAAILESPTSNLQVLGITNNNNVDDEAVAAFANALANNSTLRVLELDINPSITAKGWKAFSKLLCNTTSVNSSFLSNHTLRTNHTLRSVGTFTNEIIEPFLELNERDDKKEVATIKILQCHEDFDMMPFFEWEFKVLPLVLSWLERASEYDMPEDFDPNIERRKLSTIYQFVRGMPLLYVETRLRKELEDIRAREKQMEEQRLRFQQEFMQQMQFLQERKEVIVRKLGQPVAK